MTRSPIEAFGLICKSAANNARVNQLTPWDVVSLLAACLRHLPKDEEARAFVLEFADNVRGRDTVKAGNALSVAFHAWLDRQPFDPADLRQKGDLLEWSEQADFR